MGRNTGFRGWYYFRQGWSMYFAFLMAAVNTLTVTYYLAIEKIPELTLIFPTFSNYIIITTSIGIPVLVFVGYLHFKRTNAFKAETNIIIEANPFQRRVLVNSEVILKSNLLVNRLLIKILDNEKLDETEIKELNELNKKLEEFVRDRTFENELDLKFLKELGKS